MPGDPSEQHSGQGQNQAAERREKEPQGGGGRLGCASAGSALCRGRLQGPLETPALEETLADI